MEPNSVWIDYIVYPDLWLSFIWQRTFYLLAILAFYLVSFTTLGKKKIVIVVFLAATLVNAHISHLIFLSDGVLSPYYGVLDLTILAVGILMCWQLIEVVSFSVLTIIFYVTACVLQKDFSFATDWVLLTTQSYFILLSSIVASATCFLSAKNRWRMFFLNYSLDAKNRELEEMDRQKSRFFANTTHELRTPLTLILTPLDEMLSEHRKSLSEKALSLLELMRGNAVRLQKMVNNLLEISRLQEATKYRAEPVEVVSLLIGLVDNLRHSAEKNGLEVIVEIPDEKLWVKLDRDAFERIIYNVGDNAIKFTSEKKEGQIIFSVLREGEECLIRVKDTGIGVAKEDIAHVFERFYRGRGLTARGSGLGLMLVKELLEKMNGRIEFDSVENEGATISIWFSLVISDEEWTAVGEPVSIEDITIPREMSLSGESENSISGKEATIPQAAPLFETSAGDKKESDAYHFTMLKELTEKKSMDWLRSDQQVSHQGEQKIKVLIVDDEPDMLAYLASILGSHYAVTCAKNGRDALALASKDKYAVILLDLMMPDISGLTVCRTLRREYPEIRSRILVLTAVVDSDPKLLMLRHGANDFLGKPFSYSEVLARVHNLARNYLLERDLEEKNSSLETALGELKKNQELLVREEKLRSIGTMASGLIHEINNPVNYLMMALSALRKSLQEGESSKLTEYVNDIDEGLSQIVRITKDLHDFSQRSSYVKPESFSPGFVVDAALRLTEHLQKETVVEKKYHGTNQIIFSRQRIMQILINLLLNAYAAIEKRRQTEQLEGKVIIQSVVKKDYFVINIKDNGIGMVKNVMRQAFDPFYTKKPDGLGLGLSICHTIVNAHGGKITLDSALNQGCSVTVKIPFLSDGTLFSYTSPEVDAPKVDISDVNALEDPPHFH